MPNKEIKGRSAMSSISDAILIETINKELRFHALYEDYMLSPNAVKNLVITNKPTSALIKDGVNVEEITRITSKSHSSSAAASSERWQTEASVYGQDAVPLIRLVDPRFYHPKTVTEITKKYGTSKKTQ